MEYNGSLKNRLTIIIMLVTFTTAFISYSSFVSWYMGNQSNRTVNLSKTIALVLSQDLAKLILLNEVSSASDITSSLKSFSSLESMVLYRSDKKAILQYSKNNKSLSSEILSFNKKEEIKINNNLLELYLDATYQDMHLGYIKMNFKALGIFDIIKQDINILIFLLFLMFVTSYLLASFFAKRFTKPILSLVSFLEKVDLKESIDKRIESKENNEYGKLYKEVNIMLDRISSSHNELKLASVAFETQSGMMITDKNQRILRVNEAFSKITGYEVNDILLKRPSILKSNLHNKNFYKNMFDSLKADHFWRGEVSNKRKDGSIVSEDLTIQAVLNNKKELMYYVASFTDLTLQKKMEAKLKESERILIHQSKMAAMGEMLGNIAHQWRQPLSVISVASSGIIIKKQLGLSDIEEDISQLERINKSVQYLSSTIDDFRNFFKIDKEKEDFSLKECFKKTLNLLSSKFDSLDINIIEDIKDINIYSLENELTQVIMNVLNNAKDALELNNIPKKYIFIEIFKENDEAILIIKDNAGGIPKNIIEKIFEPYFTTKHKSSGTGIGLYMSLEMLRKHIHGDISVKNEQFLYKNEFYEGAVFKISIPL